MIGRLGEDGGFSLVEMLVVIVISAVVMGGIVALFSRGITSNAAMNNRFQAQQDGRLALDTMRRDIHGACTVSAPGSDNTAVSTVTLYYPADLCVAGVGAGGLSVTYSTVLVPAAGSVVAHYQLVRTFVATGKTQLVADFLTTVNIFDYLPPNSHVTTLGTGVGGIATVDGSSKLPRLHIDMTLNKTPTKPGNYHVVDDIALRNGVRACSTGVPSC